jgi:hypothetical protein
MIKSDVFRISFVVVFFALIVLANMPNVGFKWDGVVTGALIHAQDQNGQWKDFSFGSISFDKLNVLLWPAFFEKDVHMFVNNHNYFEYPPLLLLFENGGYDTSMATAGTTAYQPDRVTWYYGIRLFLNLAYWVGVSFIVAKGVEFFYDKKNGKKSVHMGKN